MHREKSKYRSRLRIVVALIPPLSLSLSRGNRLDTRDYCAKSRDKELFSIDRPIESIALSRCESTAARLQFTRIAGAGRAWRLQNLRVKVYASAENTYLRVPAQAVRGVLWVP